jgi:hypothetical protein
LVREPDLYKYLYTDPIQTNEDGCPLDTQKFHRPTLLLQKCVPLWEDGFHNRTQMLGLSLDGRLYFLKERELIWANPSVRLPLL